MSTAIDFDAVFSSTSSTASIIFLPDDLLWECFHRLPTTYLPTLTLVCNRFYQFLRFHPRYFASLRYHSLNHVPDQNKLLVIFVSSDLSMISNANYIKSLSSSSHTFRLSAFSIPRILHAPTKVSLAASAVIGHSLYLIGSDLTFCFDILTGTVTPCAQTLLPRSNLAATSVGGKIYVAGGASQSKTIEEYEPCSDKWRVVAKDAPHALSRCFLCASSKDQLYFFIGGAFPSIMLAYNLSTSFWSRISLKPLKRFCPSASHVVGACAVRDRIYLLVQSDEYMWFVGLNPAELGCSFCDVYHRTTIKYNGHGVIHFSCTSMGDNKLAVLIEVPEESAKTMEITTMVFDLKTFEWIRMLELVPPLNGVKFTGICSWS